MPVLENGYSWDNPDEKSCVLGIEEDIQTNPGVTFRELLKGRNIFSLRPALNLLIKAKRIAQVIELGRDDLQDAERFFPR